MTSNSALYRTALILVACVAGLSPLASATAGDLDTTTRAYSGTVNPLGGAWQGEEALSNSSSSAMLDWAVFESNDFQLFLTDIGSNASNPSTSGEFVYAYQLVDIDTTSGISMLTVGIDGDETISGPTAPDPSWLSNTEFTANLYPSLGSNQGGTSMAWQLPLAATGDTTILFFVSPNLPELDNATMQAGAGIAQVIGVIGSPSNLVPEPSTCFLVFSALALVGSTRRSWRRSV